MAGKINGISIREKAINSLKFRKVAQQEAKRKFERAKAGLLQDFLNDVVTREIRGGSTASNSSGTLTGYGNLFSYIGFYENIDPVEPLESYLRNFSFSVKQVRSARGGLTIQLNWFNLDTIKALSGMPWEEGNSWVMGIERGISGFGHYMYDLGKGRSGAAIQKESPVENVSTFSTRRYLPSMLEEARRRIRKI
jgi:hypothetical protein